VTRVQLHGRGGAPERGDGADEQEQAVQISAPLDNRVRS